MDLKEIDKIKDQFGRNQWPKFLESISIDGLRGLHNQRMHFRFPVVAIVGENGTGKSTFLKTAACAYVGESRKTYYLSDFFMTTHWDKITGVSLEYTIHQVDQTIQFKMGKKNKKWSYSSSSSPASKSAPETR